ncbi:hypothetical protein R5R35_014233 [Gryllus longicercus]|uniref:Uncharacterized protein n=1 Tax=Gryllus longicercus TaxID=2509291 RepID=A0AAN9V298_9ORTH
MGFTGNEASVVKCNKCTVRAQKSREDEEQGGAAKEQEGKAEGCGEEWERIGEQSGGGAERAWPRRRQMGRRCGGGRARPVAPGWAIAAARASEADGPVGG